MAGATINFDRPSSIPTIDTPIDFTVKGAEKPNAPADFSLAGSTSVIDALIKADANEDIGTLIASLYRIEVTPSMTSAGVVKVTVKVTPIKGDTSLGTITEFYVPHDQNMDEWQTDAGRPRQP